MRLTVIWLTCTFTVTISLLTILLLLIGVSADTPVSPDLLSRMIFQLFPIASALVGGLIAARRPGNPIGWLLLGAPATVAVQGFAYAYALYGLNETHPLPGAALAAWMEDWLQWASVLFLFEILLLFPDGRFVSPRWRAVAWPAAIVPLLVGGVGALDPSGPFDFPTVGNPLGWASHNPVFDWIFGTPLILLMPVMLVICGVAVLVRFRRSHGVERQQLKWFVYAIAVIVATFFVGNPLWFGGWGALLNNLSFVALPVTIAIAVLRYDLYEIDRLINRTLVYGLLTVFLGLCYWIGVVVLQQVLRAITQGSELAIVGSTLAVAALFQPLRHRVQQMVDRRFYRQRYDAGRTLEAFSSRLRNQVDLDSLGAELLAVVGQTMQPERLSLWLRQRDRRPS